MECCSTAISECNDSFYGAASTNSFYLSLTIKSLRALHSNVDLNISPLYIILCIYTIYNRPTCETSGLYSACCPVEVLQIKLNWSAGAQPLWKPQLRIYHDNLYGRPREGVPQERTTQSHRFNSHLKGADCQITLNWGFNEPCFPLRMLFEGYMGV